MQEVSLYTDGACSGNPGNGGWACLLVCGSKEKQLCGGCKQTTNNKMELTAVIEGLKALSAPCSVHIYTDSKYVMDGFTKWLNGWQSRGWKKADNKPVLNQELWQELYHVSQQHHLTWTWIKGHAGHPENERVDELACMQRDLHSL